MKTLKSVIIGALALLSTPALSQQVAFPGADGMGKYAKGGRGGEVYQVTNLLDTGPGSLRACVEASGPRTCIPRVSGDIFLNSELRIVNPYFTYAGQAGPGQGIQLRHGNNLRHGISVGTHDVVIRHLTIRLGPTVQKSDIPNCIGILPQAGNVPQNLVFDHISCAWATDQLMALSPDTDKITFSWSIFDSGLNKSTHVQSSHSKGPNIRSCGVTMVGNLISNSVIRNPNNTCGYDDGTGVFRPTTGGIVGENEFRNNVVFNGQDAFLDYWNGRGVSWLNVVGNVFIKGPNTKAKLIAAHSIYPVDAWDQSGRTVPSGTTEPQNLCLQDNIAENFPATFIGGAPLYGVLNPNDAHLVRSTDCVNNPVGRVGDLRGITGPVLPSSEVKEAVFERVGAFYWNRNTADARLIANTAAGIGAIIDHPNQAGGWPILQTGTPSVDSDNDGMPNEFELRFGLNPNNANDRNGDLDSDGFTNLEEYLSEAAFDQVGMGLGNLPPPVVELVGATQTNWAEGATASFNLLRVGDLNRVSTVTLDEVGFGSVQADAADFVNGLRTDQVVTFDVGVSEVLYTMPIAQDSLVEQVEEFGVVLKTAENAVLGTQVAATAFIDNDDVPPPPPTTFAVGAVVVLKSNAAVHDPINAPRLGVNRAGIEGTIVEGPQTFSGNKWWKVNFNTDFDGWVRESSLAVR